MNRPGDLGYSQSQRPRHLAAQQATDTALPVAGNTAISYLCWLACFSGVCGVHRLYNGKVATGLLWMFTFGCLGIGQLVDLAFIPEMSRERVRRLRDRRYQLSQHHSPTLVEDNVPKAPPLTMQILKLAKRNHGRLTVTDCVLETGAAIGEIEQQLKELVKSGYAHVTNDTHSGVVVYEIPELFT